MTDIIVILACSACGFAIGKYFERRIRGKARFFDDLNRYAALFRVNVQGRQLEADLFNSQFAENCGKEFGAYLNGGKPVCALNAAEKHLLEDFFNCLKAVSSAEMLKQMDIYSQRFGELSAKYTAEAGKAAIFPKLGALLGAMSGIVLI